MWSSVRKNAGFAPYNEYIEPRLSIGNMVSDKQLSTGHFAIQVDPEALALIIRHDHRVLWKSVHNFPFLLSSQGKDIIGKDDTGSMSIEEIDEHKTMLQTVTKIVSGSDGTSVQIFGGLGTRIVQPTHMDFVLTFKEVSPTRLSFHTTISHRDENMEKYNRLFLVLQSEADETFFGCGAQFSHVALNGQKVPILFREPSLLKKPTTSASILQTARSIFGGDFVGLDEIRSCCAVPQIVTSTGRCLFLENTEYASIDLTRPDRVAIRLNSSTMRGSILSSEDIRSSLTEYTLFAGRMRPLPEWTQEGVLLGVTGGKEKTEHLLNRLSHRNVPVAAICVEDRSGLALPWWMPSEDKEKYLNWSAWVDELKSKGIRVVDYVSPAIVKDDNTLFSEGESDHFLIKSPAGCVYHINTDNNTGGIVDLANPKAQAWFKDIVKKRLWDGGIDGLLADITILPYKSSLANVQSAEPLETYHNQFPDDWSRLNAQIMDSLDAKDDLLLAIRSGFTHSAGNANLAWTGYHSTSWDSSQGIKSAVMAALSCGFSGYTVTHSAVGGYVNTPSNMLGVQSHRTNELLVRWMELGACMPVFRTTEGLLPETNAQLYDDDTTIEYLSHTVRLFTALSPYRQHLLTEAVEKGWPLWRSLAFYYPQDSHVREIQYQQFLVGSSLMVAPTLSPGQGFIRVYFPKDEHHISWRHIWTGKYYHADGSIQRIDTPLGEPAWFIKEPREDDNLLKNLLEYVDQYVNYKMNPPKTSLNQ